MSHINKAKCCGRQTAGNEIYGCKKVVTETSIVNRPAVPDWRILESDYRVRCHNCRLVEFPCSEVFLWKGPDRVVHNSGFGAPDQSSTLGAYPPTSPVHPTQTLKRRPHEHVSTLTSLRLDKFYLLVWTGKMPSVSLTSLLVEKLACQLFNKETCQRKTWHISPSTRANKTCQGGNVLLWTTRQPNPNPGPNPGDLDGPHQPTEPLLWETPGKGTLPPSEVGRWDERRESTRTKHLVRF